MKSRNTSVIYLLYECAKNNKTHLLQGPVEYYGYVTTIHCLNLTRQNRKQWNTTQVSPFQHSSDLDMISRSWKLMRSVRLVMVITLQLLSWCDAQPDKNITRTHMIFSMHTKKSKWCLSTSGKIKIASSENHHCIHLNELFLMVLRFYHWTVRFFWFFLATFSNCKEQWEMNYISSLYINTYAVT